MKTSLGEGGGLVSGGEGQRVRLGRAFYRSGVRLVILDEPFRGLDRDSRRLLLDEARKQWGGTTLICITHDVGETLSFPRVFVIEEGRIIEDGTPKQLAAEASSRYHALLMAEANVRENLWGDVEWKRLTMDEGRMSVTNE
jgi:ABC-type transport system involved in cytochrome bd biosynthesis fused ATPase/permease subunit